MSVKLIVPLRVEVKTERKTKPPRYDKYALNLNWFRNAYHHQINGAKRTFRDVVLSQLGYGIGEWDFEPYKAVSVSFTIHPSNKRAFDLDNFGSILSKFTLDALQDIGIIEEDNYLVVKKISFQIGDADYDSEYHYADVEVAEIEG